MDTQPLNVYLKHSKSSFKSNFDFITKEDANENYHYYYRWCFHLAQNKTVFSYFPSSFYKASEFFRIVQDMQIEIDQIKANNSSSSIVDHLIENVFKKFNEDRLHRANSQKRLIPYQQSSQSNEDESEPEYEVEAILDYSVMYDREWFLVKWTNYPVEESTWEPFEHVNHLSDFLTKFFQGYCDKFDFSIYNNQPVVPPSIQPVVPPAASEINNPQSNIPILQPISEYFQSQTTNNANQVNRIPILQPISVYFQNQNAGSFQLVLPKLPSQLQSQAGVSFLQPISVFLSSQTMVKQEHI